MPHSASDKNLVPPSNELNDQPENEKIDNEQQSRVINSVTNSCQKNDVHENVNDGVSNIFQTNVITQTQNIHLENVRRPNREQEFNENPIEKTQINNFVKALFTVNLSDFTYYAPAQWDFNETTYYKIFERRIINALSKLGEIELILDDQTDYMKMKPSQEIIMSSKPTNNGEKVDFNDKTNQRVDNILKQTKYTLQQEFNSVTENGYWEDYNKTDWKIFIKDVERAAKQIIKTMYYEGIRIKT